MYSRAIVTENNDPDTEMSLNFKWDSAHPGSRISQYLIEYIRPRINDQMEEICTFDGFLIYIYWNKLIQMGFVTVLTYSETSFKLESTLFASSIWEIQLSPPINKDDMERILVNKEAKETDFTYTFDLDWIKTSLNGGQINLHYQRDGSFISKLAYFLQVFPWIFYSLNYGKIDETQITLTFHNNEGIQSYDYQNYLLKIIDTAESQFRILLSKALLVIEKTHPNKRIEKLVSYLDFIHNITEDHSVDEYIDLLLLNGSYLWEIDSNYFAEFVSSLILNLYQVKENLSMDLLIDFSDFLHTFNLEDLIKLLDGTILEILFSLKVEKRKYLVDLAKKSTIWGISYIISYLELVSSMLNLDEIHLLLDLIPIVEEELYDDWDGLLTLFSLYNSLNMPDKAAILRFQAISVNKDPMSKAMDVFKAIADISTLALDEDEFKDIFIHNFGYGISHMPTGELFEYYFNEVIQNLSSNKKITLLNAIIDWIQFNTNEISTEDRLNTFKILNTHIAGNSELSQPFLKTQLLQFNQLLEQYEMNSDLVLLEQAEKLMKSIYNDIDPKTERFREKITIITQSIILSAAFFSNWDLIQDSLHRFKLLLKDDMYYTEAVVQIFINAGKSRLKLDADKVKKNDIGLKIFDETIRLISNNKNYIKYSFTFLPLAKELSIKVRDYKRYTIYSTLELNLNRLSKLPWVDSLLESALNLVTAGEISSARQLFDTALGAELKPEEEYELLAKQLELAEIELDIVKIDEISKKRERMISLAQLNPEIASFSDIMDSYRNGISEILSKGSSHELHTFLLRAIRFGHEHDFSNLHDFFRPLDESLEQLYELYGNNKIPAYNEIIYIIRELSSIFILDSFPSLVKYYSRLLNENFTQFQSDRNSQFLIRNILFLKEIGWQLNKVKSLDHSIVEIVNFRKLIDNQLTHIEKSFDEMVIMDFIQDLTPIFIKLNNFSKLLNIADNSFVVIKKSIISNKLPEARLLLIIFKSAEILQLLSLFEDSRQYNEFLDMILKTVRVIFTITGLNSELRKIFQEIYDSLSNDIFDGIDLLKQNYANVIGLIDSNNL
ncbi:MAG: hypothetical protein INQ03_06425 [Candidatus Heimdallarchaeota archaeon]|nr:hypothetical protein [Candidatus Heimdallarchaeota archaeon]